jgi:hypothetical protein
MESSDKAIARLDYGIKKYQEQITRLKEFQKIYKGTKVEEKLEDEVKKLEVIIQDLENLKPTVLDRLRKSKEKKVETPRKIVKVVVEDVPIGEKVNEKLIESAKTAEESQKTTIDILQRISEERKQENIELRKQIGKLQESSDSNHGQAIRVAWTFGIGALILAFVLAALT